MPVFNYVAKDQQGEYHRGEIETSAENQAANILMRKRLIIISLKIKSERKGGYFDRFIHRVSFSDVVIFTRQLATMIQAGLVLSEALDILEDQEENESLKVIIDKISQDIKGGIDLASALEKYPQTFPPIYAKLVRAGQASGKLDTILLNLSDSLEKQRDFQGRVTGAMIYPAVVITMMFGVMLIMVFFVMPKLLSLYQGSNIELPLPTKIMLGFVNIMLNFWWAILMVLIILVLAFRRYVITPQGRYTVDGLMLRIPIIGKIQKLVVMTNFTRTFALLVSSGLPILESIKITSDISGNMVYKKIFDASYKGVERGLPFSSQLIGIPLFPKIVGQMIRTGEETGKLDEVMFKLADYFDSETENILKNVTTLIEPIILVVLGVGVAFLVLSIILPIYQLTTSIH